MLADADADTAGISVLIGSFGLYVAHELARRRTGVLQLDSGVTGSEIDGGGRWLDDGSEADGTAPIAAPSTGVSLHVSGLRAGVVTQHIVRRRACRQMSEHEAPCASVKSQRVAIRASYAAAGGTEWVAARLAALSGL